MPGPWGDVRVASLHRYPVKSMLGEDVGHLDVDARGIAGDRRWSVRTTAGKIGSGKNTRRFAAVPGLLDLRAADDGGIVVITFPDGSSCAVNGDQAQQRLSRHAGEPLTLAAETDVSHFDDGQVSLLGTASVEAVAAELGSPVDAARFRANVVLTTATAFAEDQLVGTRIGLGTAVLRVTMTSTRCVMVDAETVDLPPQPGVLAATGRLHQATLGVIAEVVMPGRISVGDVPAVLGR